MVDSKKSGSVWRQKPQLVLFGLILVHVHTHTNSTYARFHIKPATEMLCMLVKVFINTSLQPKLWCDNIMGAALGCAKMNCSVQVQIPGNVV